MKLGVKASAHLSNADLATGKPHIIKNVAHAVYKGLTVGNWTYPIETYVRKNAGGSNSPNRVCKMGPVKHV